MAARAARQFGAVMRRNGARRPVGVIMLRSGGLGMPTGSFQPPTKPVDIHRHELIWDGGDGLPEPMFPEGGGEGPYSKWECVGMLAGALGMFAVVGWFAKLRNDSCKVPFAPKEYPWLDEWDLLKLKENEKGL